jgi:hypothetical protein
MKRSVAAPAATDRFIDSLETIDIESRETLARTLAGAWTLDRQTNFHRMWNGTTARSATMPELQVDYREAIPGTGAKSMLILEVMSPAFTIASVRARYPHLRLIGGPDHDCPAESWSYEIPDRDPQLVLSFDYSNSYLQTVAILPRLTTRRRRDRDAKPGHGLSIGGRCGSAAMRELNAVTTRWPGRPHRRRRPAAIRGLPAR